MKKETLNTITVNTDLCIGCGKCVKDCVANRLYISDGKAIVREDSCIMCGHCFAVCPEGAVEMPGADISGCEKLGDMTDINPDEFLLALKSRRTIRQFKDKPVSRETIDKIIEAGRYCPTGTNMQDIAYTVITDSLGELEAPAVEKFRSLVKTASPFSNYLKNTEIDDRFFFKGAPLVIVVSGKSKTHAGLASSYMELMAESMGLGVLYSGFFIAAIKLSGKIKKQLDIPKGLTPFTCMVIGYPDVTYKRIPPRKKPQIKFI